MDDPGERGFDGTELDFWLGEWDCAWEGGHGTNRFTRILADRVILEEFEAAPDPDGSGALKEEGGVRDTQTRLVLGIVS